MSTQRDDRSYVNIGPLQIRRRLRSGILALLHQYRARWPIGLFPGLTLVADRNCTALLDRPTRPFASSRKNLSIPRRLGKAQPRHRRRGCHRRQQNSTIADTGPQGAYTNLDRYHTFARDSTDTIMKMTAVPKGSFS